MKLNPWKNDVAVLLIFFVRDDVFAQTFDAVRQARPRKLLLWQDGARNDHPDDIAGIERCRKIADNIDWECEVYRNYQTKNWGCDPSTFYSHRWAFSIVDKCIILEDDCVPAQSFFPFCKELLDLYENDIRVNRICGFNNETITEYCPYDYFFSQGGSVWGWATWKRVADTWDENYSFAKESYEMNLLKSIVDRDYNEMHKKLLRHIKLGRAFWESINSYSRLLNHQLVIVPKKSLVTNIGATENATHSIGNMNALSSQTKKLLSMKVYELNRPIVHPRYMVSDISYYNRISKTGGFWQKIESVIKRLINFELKSIYTGFLRFTRLRENDI